MSLYDNLVIALTCVMQNEISSHVNPNVVFISMPFWKIPSSIVPQITHLTCNMIVLFVTCPIYLVMIISISCDKKYLCWPYKSSWIRFCNLQDILTTYSLLITLCFPCNMPTNHLNASLCQSILVTCVLHNEISSHMSIPNWCLFPFWKIPFCIVPH